MNIIGIDPGTLITGYGIIRSDGREHAALDYGCIKPPRNLDLHSRYLVLLNDLERLLEKYRPHIVVVETQYVKRNPQSAIKLGMARGIVIACTLKKGISIVEYAPAQAKRAVTGAGGASKAQVQGMVQKLLCLKQQPPIPEDAADALALAICHAHTIKWS